MYDRITIRLVEKNCLAHRLFTKPAPTAPAANATTPVNGRGTKASS